MPTLLCVTGNTVKFEIAKNLFSKYDVNLEQIVADIDEIQGDDPEVIVRDKVNRAYALVGKPVVVTDDSWSIPALNGFPGAYMKYINQWFTPQDYLNLMQGKENRRTVLLQFVAYKDAYETVVFSSAIYGNIVTNEPRGSFGPSIMKVTEEDGDDGMTISEVYDSGKEHTADRLTRSSAWDELAKWYSEKIAV